jgi:hypothetical protein
VRKRTNRLRRARAFEGFTHTSEIKTGLARFQQTLIQIIL